jgi:hypothetical protein
MYSQTVKNAVFSGQNVFIKELSMRNLLALLGAGTLTFVGLGWYLDWYKIERKPSPTAGTQRLEVDLNPNKIGSDVATGLKRGSEIIEHLTDKEANPGSPAKPGNGDKDKPSPDKP